jgi:hypothetical protein
MADWTGDERRSPESIEARAAVSARTEAERFQAPLESLPRMRFTRRRDLERRLAEARSREREAVSTLGGQLTAGD